MVLAIYGPYAATALRPVAMPNTRSAFSPLYGGAGLALTLLSLPPQLWSRTPDSNGDLPAPKAGDLPISPMRVLTVTSST